MGEAQPVLPRSIYSEGGSSTASHPLDDLRPFRMWELEGPLEVALESPRAWPGETLSGSQDGTHCGGSGCDTQSPRHTGACVPHRKICKVGSLYSAHQTQTSMWASSCPWLVSWSAPGATFSCYS